jgi:parvulin-like peptidyl-prolyl isomerase
MAKYLAASVLIVGFCALAVFGGCSKGEKVSEETASKYAAEVGDWNLARVDLDKAIESLPDHQKQKYSTPEGRAELAERFIEEEIYFQEALKKGYRKDEKIRDFVKKYERALMVAEYFDREIKVKAAPTEEKIREYYETRKDKFMIQPIARAQHILASDSLKLVKLMKRVEAGEKFTTLAHENSEDALTGPQGGDLGFFNPGGFIRDIGYAKELGDAAFSMKVGEMRIVKWEKGYSLLVLNEMRSAQVRPLEEVGDEVKEALTRQELDSVKKVAFAQLRPKYDVTNYLAEEMMLTERTAEELWNLAQNSTDSYQRLRYYEQIVKKYPDNKYAPEALFMMGFVWAEELQSVPDADRAFNRVINEYPNAEVAKTAEWMLQNLDKPLPEFEDIRDLQQKIDAESK